jgi:hypothetical protein
VARIRDDASIQFFDEKGSVYVWSRASGQSLEANRRGRSVILKSEDISRSNRDYDLTVVLLSACA